MTGVSNLNMVMQQGVSVQEMVHPKQHSVEHAQMVAARQEALRETAEREKVAESANPEKVSLNKDKPKERKEKRRSPDEDRKRKKAIDDRSAARIGNLLDTIV